MLRTTRLPVKPGFGPWIGGFPFRIGMIWLRRAGVVCAVLPGSAAIGIDDEANAENGS